MAIDNDDLNQSRSEDSDSAARARRRSTNGSEPISEPTRSGRRIPPRLPGSVDPGSSRSALAPRRPTDRDSNERRPYTSDYSRTYTPRPSADPVAPKKSISLPSSLTVIALVALVSFFGGFALSYWSSSNNFDDRNVVTPEEIPLAFRNFCIGYNGYASITVVELTTVSALTMATVPVLKLETCTIPVNQTANALQALGVEQRSQSIGPQLGGSNLTLITMPITTGIAQALYDRFPALAGSNPDPAAKEKTLQELETAVSESFTSNIGGLNLQSLIKTNIPNTYVMIPGHSFNLKPQLHSQ